MRKYFEAAIFNLILEGSTLPILRNMYTMVMQIKKKPQKVTNWRPKGISRKKDISAKYFLRYNPQSWWIIPDLTISSPLFRASLVFAALPIIHLAAVLHINIKIVKTPHDTIRKYWKINVKDIMKDILRRLYHSRSKKDLRHLKGRFTVKPYNRLFDRLCTNSKNRDPITSTLKRQVDPNRPYNIYLNAW